MYFLYIYRYLIKKAILLLFLSCFSSDYFFRAVFQAHSKLEGKVQISDLSLPSHMHSLPH